MEEKKKTVRCILTQQVLDDNCNDYGKKRLAPLHNKREREGGREVKPVDKKKRLSDTLSFSLDREKHVSLEQELFHQQDDVIAFSQSK